MSNEATVRSNLQIVKGSTVYNSQPTVFQADVTVTGGGPAPGQKTAGVGGINIDFTPLTNPSLFRIQNLDPTNFITYGVYDAESAEFYPLGEVLPGETYVGRISRHLTTIYPLTGTGSPGAPLSFHVRADAAPCKFLLEAFDK